MVIRRSDLLYDMIDIYIQDPSPTPDAKNMVFARPYEFLDDKPIKFASTSPHSGQGMFFTDSEITVMFGFNFIGCPITRIGMPKIIPPFEDPFINPFNIGKLNDSDIDKNLVDALSAFLPSSDKSLINKVNWDD